MISCVFQIIFPGTLAVSPGFFPPVEAGNYKDATIKAQNMRLENPSIVFKICQVGDCVEFGTYEQDNDASNGKEAIEWLVLEVQNGKILIISKYGLDCRPYNTDWEDITWETCTLRKWLNGEFINAAFNKDEKQMIHTATVPADRNPEYDKNPGNPTEDKVFLLSVDEANRYFSSDETRQCRPTEHAVANGAYQSDSGNCWWWLRSPGDNQNNAAYVNNNGGVNVRGSGAHGDDSAVRPALWIDLSKR